MIKAVCRWAVAGRTVVVAGKGCDCSWRWLRLRQQTRGLIMSQTPVMAAVVASDVEREGCQTSDVDVGIK
ncbi:hypothetical protein GW17_00053720 [Ensete ventricosum]|nr:hypothetical protein GW17_00053720 [Ensete ventricosum]RZS04129.1 hypothetical protein BHM03_00034417 [Ensete ventricosum]